MCNKPTGSGDSLHITHFWQIREVVCLYLSAQCSIGRSLGAA
jgi:hypothetical protein